MKADNFVLQEYFDRINFNGKAKADFATIVEMMRCQLFSVPFENLDVQAGKIVSLVPEEIVDKIIVRKRGGYCFEVNGLFAMALEALGVPYQFVAARPMLYPVRKPRTHMAIVVNANGEEWLCDLGFGSYGIRAPLRLDLLDAEIKQDFDTFKLSKTNEREYLLQALVEGTWTDQFAFDLSPQEWIDFVPANYLSSTHPDAIFVQKLVVVLHNPKGRISLSGDILKTVIEGRIEKQTIRPEDTASILSSRFHLKSGT
jgi:N-hydroxyarylamine O-acetyltransferase